MLLKLRLFYTSVLLLFVYNAFGQISFDSQEELVKAANSFFDAKEYEKAKPLFSQLLSKDAMNPDYNYRFGVCILFTEADPLKPLPYIEGGASSNGVNKEAYYFLGKAYQYNYRFDDAITYYEKGKKAGYNSPDVDLEKSIDECRNGKILYNSSIDFEPAQDKEVIASEFYRPYDFRKLKGKVIPMPPSFKTKFDEKNLLGTVVYTPLNSTTLVYASYGEDGANAKDLYRVNRLPSGEWALPQRLPNTINTKYDEDYAFFDEEANVLFFASKGHNTMGGYDVFSSEYEPSTNTWSVPVNLQYPINSPFDDFLYVSDPDGKVAFFTSKRGTEVGKLKVFKTLLYDPEQVELSIVEGTYEDKTDSVFNYMVATVLDPKTNQVIGKYRSQRETGKYVLILPPQNDYVMDVGPREADGFKFDLDVPQTEDQKSLGQKISYSTNNGQGTVTLTNYFDATGNPDSVAFAESRSQQEIEAQMVAMPDPSEILAARKVQSEKKQQEELSLLEEVAAAEAAILAQEREAQEAELQRLKIEEELKAKEKAEKEAAEAAILLAQEKEQLRLDSIASAEKLAAQLAVQKAERERLKREEELKAKQKAEKDAALLLADQREKERLQLDSIAKAEKLAAQLAIQEAFADSVEAVAAKMRKDSLDQIALELERSEQLKVAELRAKFKADSLAQVEALAIQKQAEQELKAQAMQDSLLVIKLQREADSLQFVERLALEQKQRLERIEREVAEAKAKALRDSSLQMDLTTAEEADHQTLLEEMAAKEAEILARQSKTETTTDSIEIQTIIEAETVADIASPADQSEILNTATMETVEEAEVISEADLFLQTIAQLEAQKNAQEAEVAAENKKLIEERKAARTPTAPAPSTVLSDSTEVALTVNTADSLTSTKPTEIEIPVSEQTSVALKSDANPDDYLAALAEIEKQIAADQVASTKSYELQELPVKRTEPVGAEMDPVLQATIDADRKAIEEHQKIAVEKEKALRDQMAQDKQIIKSVADTDLKEVDAIEQEMLKELGIEPIVETTESTIETEAITAETELLEIEEQAIVKASDEANETVISEADDLMNQLESVSEPESIPESVLEEPIASEPVVEEPVVKEVDAMAEVVDESVSEVSSLETVAEAPVVIDATENDVLEPMDEGLEELIAEADEIVEVVEAEPKEEVPAISESGEEEQAVSEVVIAETPESSAVLPAVQHEYSPEVALRDYSKRSVDFSQIADPVMKKMVKRLRAEDIGRMAVLKNMKNKWVDAGKTQDALAEIKSNGRNQDVLANLSESTPKEEVLKNPFRSDDLRARQGVYYKLDLRLTPANVSETIAETMTPEQAVSFAMPDFQLSTGYFTNLADATAEMRYYRSRGLAGIQVVAFSNGEQILLSDVQNIPFID